MAKIQEQLDPANNAGTAHYLAALALKMEQSKIPEFFGQKAKDTIKALELIKTIDSLMGSIGWKEQVAFHNFHLALRGSALNGRTPPANIRRLTTCKPLLNPFSM
jgi:hypothetical protein